MSLDIHRHDRWTDEAPVSPFSGSPLAEPEVETGSTDAPPPWDHQVMPYERPEPGVHREEAPPWVTPTAEGGVRPEPAPVQVDDRAGAAWLGLDEAPLTESDTGTGSSSTPAMPGFLDAETEAFLDEIWQSASTLVEQSLVRRAITKGTTNENELTDLVFFRRHPERNGRTISRSEPNFQALADEWLQIRDVIVRPALQSPGRTRPGRRGGIRPGRRGGTRPRPGGGSGQPDTGEWATKRGELVRVALEEWAYWDNGSLKEDQQRGWERVERYWDETVGWTPSDLRGSALATTVAWSGVLISWVVGRAGIGKDIWTPWSNHSGYMVSLLRNAAGRSDFPITLVPPYSVAPRPGDLINNWRDKNKPYDLDALRRWPPDAALPTFSGHTDIVTRVVPGSHINVVGGNKSNSVGQAELPIDGSGRLKTRTDLVAVIRMGP